VHVLELSSHRFVLRPAHQTPFDLGPSPSSLPGHRGPPRPAWPARKGGHAGAEVQDQWLKIRGTV